MESQLAQLQTKAKMQEQLLKAKEDEVLLKWECVVVANVDDATKRDCLI